MMRLIPPKLSRRDEIRLIAPARSLAMINSDTQMILIYDCNALA
jgi:hypothetical protein